VFDFPGHPQDVAVEVTAGWGFYFLNPGKIHATLNAGHRVGFVGSSDSHRRNPGLGGGITGIYATELTPEAVLDAYRARRAFATNGSRFAVEAPANGVRPFLSTFHFSPVTFGCAEVFDTPWRIVLFPRCASASPETSSGSDGS
jgi:hypothetical protein